ncbi:MAG TPA: hypothetical protein PLF40_21400 [Kofleriaceae bacterium]|nr:hypothetical protein [Kofleriaceae bacterium]
MPSATSQALLEASVGLLQRAELLRPADCDTVARLALQCAAACDNAAAAKLAFAIERICDELAAGRVAVGISLPSLCAAADQLHAVMKAPAPSMANALEAARFELDTLLPLPSAPPPSRPVIAASTLLRRADVPPEDPRTAMQRQRAQRIAQTPLREALRTLRDHYQP